MPTAARWEEKRNPNEWRRTLPVEAASGLNDGLGRSWRGVIDFKKRSTSPIVLDPPTGAANSMFPSGAAHHSSSSSSREIAAASHLQILAPSSVSILGSSLLLPTGSVSISQFDFGSSSPFHVQAFWGFMFSLISKTSNRARSRVWGVSSGLTNRSTRTLPPLATSSSTRSDFSSPPAALQSAPPVNSIR